MDAMVSGKAEGKSTARIVWMDVAKAFAIFGVLLDHSNTVLYTDPNVAWASYYSVSLFILLMGVLQYPSFAKAKGAVGKKVLQKVWRIYRAYAVATVVYSCCADRAFDLANIWHRLLFYNACGPFYYVALYIQLLVATPLLVHWLRKWTGWKGWAADALGLVAVFGASVLTTNGSNLLGIYGGGGKLFGGTYLILLYLGLWFGKHHEAAMRAAKSHKWTSAGCFAALALLTAAWAVYYPKHLAAIEGAFPFRGIGVNPPGACLETYAVLLAGAVFFGCSLAGPVGEKALAPLTFIGKNTLFIFLYHWLVLDVILNRMNFLGLRDVSIWPKRVAYAALMLLLPVLFSKISDWTENWIRKAYRA